MSALVEEFQKLAQEGIISRTKRRIGVAKEFIEPSAEGLIGILAAKGLGARRLKHLLSAGGVGAVHGTYRKTKKYAG